MGRIIDLVEPLVNVMPQVAAPSNEERARLSARPLVKVFWSLMALLVYLICSQVPLYGINKGQSDPFYLMRSILASNRGSLMELGISPIVTSGTIMQVLVGAKIIDVDLTNPGSRDARLFNTASRALGILICLGTSCAYVLAGFYGPVSQLGATLALMIIAQLFTAGMIVVMLDDMLSKGYGISGGLNLFLVTNICEGIIWGMFSPMTINKGGKTQFEGAVISVFHLLLTEPNKLSALNQIFFREGLPNLSSVLATLFIFLVVIYVEGLKIDIPLTAVVPGATVVKHPIKLFYTTNMPIILLTAILGNVYFFSQVFYKRYGENPLVRLLGVWADDASGRSRPIWGLSYAISPPSTLFEVVENPLHTLFYTAFMLLMCALFARMWIEVSQSGPATVYKNIQVQYGRGIGEDKDCWTDKREAKIVLSPKRNVKDGKIGQPLYDRLKQVVPTAAMTGGMCIAMLFIVGDLFNCLGSATGILLAVTIIFDMYERLAKESGPGGIDGLWNSFWGQETA